MCNHVTEQNLKSFQFYCLHLADVEFDIPKEDPMTLEIYKLFYMFIFIFYVFNLFLLTLFISSGCT